MQLRKFHVYAHIHICTHPAVYRYTYMHIPYIHIHTYHMCVYKTAAESWDATSVKQK